MIDWVGLQIAEGIATRNTLRVCCVCMFSVRAPHTVRIGLRWAHRKVVIGATR